MIAESDKFEIVEGNVYFPPESVKSEFLRPSDNRREAAVSRLCARFRLGNFPEFEARRPLASQRALARVG